MSLLPARMKKIQSKMKANKLIVRFFRRSRVANSEVSGGIPPKFELIQAFIVVLVACKNEKDPIKIKALECYQDFPHYKSIGVFFKRSRAANSAVHGLILPNLELVRDLMVFLHTYNNEEDPIKNEDARVLTRLYVVFFRRSRAANSKVSGRILPKFELIQAFIVALVICKNEEDPIKNEGARVLTRFSPL